MDESFFRSIILTVFSIIVSSQTPSGDYTPTRLLLIRGDQKLAAPGLGLNRFLGFFDYLRQGCETTVSGVRGLLNKEVRE